MKDKVIFLILMVLSSFTAFGKCPVTMTLMTPNKTDMRELISEYKEKGWEIGDKLVFKEYIGYFQVMALSCEKEKKEKEKEKEDGDGDE